MDFERIRYSFSKLPWHNKLVLVSSLALVISALLPWYADLDSYRVGDQFLGVTGPTSFIGITILLFGGASFFVALQQARGHKVRLPIPQGVLHLIASAQSLLLLFLVNSIYFHPKFGVNITLKESRFGMIIALASALTLFVGAYMQHKMERENNDEIGRLEPLIKMDAVKSNETPGMTERPVYQGSERDHGTTKSPAQEPERKRVMPVVRGRQLEGFTMTSDRHQESLRQRVEQKDEHKRQASTQQWRVDL